MKPLALIAFALPAIVFAQDAAPVSLTKTWLDKQKVAASETDRLAKAYAFPEAVKRAEEFAVSPMLPLPSVDVATLLANPAKIQDHVKNVIDASDANMHILSGRVTYAIALRQSGQWEKAAEVLAQAETTHKQNTQAFRDALQPVLQMWEKLDADAKTFIAANQAKLQADEAALKAEEERLKKVRTDAETSKKKLTKAESDQYNADAKAFNEKMSPAFVALSNAFNQHKANLGRVDAIKKQLGELEAPLTGAGNVLSKNLSSIQTSLKEQNSEIEKFNEKLAAKKKKANGPKEWVAAVMEETNNLTAIRIPFDQMCFLNRLAHLEPTNKKVNAAIENIKAGREPFYVEPKAKGKGGKSKGSK